MRHVQVETRIHFFKGLTVYLLLALASAALPAYAAVLLKQPCIGTEDTSSHINKDVCVKAHIYDVVAMPGGITFLDTCSPETNNGQCHFTIASMPEDRDDVGNLNALRGRDIEIRGNVRDFPRSSTPHREILLTHERQLHGGAEKFRPNPELLHKYSAEDHSLAFRDPNTRTGQGKASLRGNSNQ
jgi:hypothetical protein